MLGPSHHQWRSRCSDFFWCVFGEKKTSTKIHPVKSPHSNQQKWWDDFQHEPQSLWNPRRPFISLSLYNIRNIPKKHRLFVESCFWVFFGWRKTQWRCCWPIFPPHFGPSGCGEVNDAVGEWRGFRGGGGRMDFPCGGASVGVGSLEWLPFYPFYWVFPKNICDFFWFYSVYSFCDIRVEVERSSEQVLVFCLLR